VKDWKKKKKKTINYIRKNIIDAADVRKKKIVSGSMI